MPDSPTSTARQVAVIGAGVAGLAAATRLAELGHRVHVYEAAPVAGGRARSFVDPDYPAPIDNGQHLLMACYRESFAFFDRIASPRSALQFQPAIETTMVKRGGRVGRFAAPASLPVNLGLALGIAKMRSLSWRARASALGLGAALGAGLPWSRPKTKPKGQASTETVSKWLRRMRQPADVRALFWDPLCWATLNENPDHADAGLLWAVLRRAFFDRDADPRLVVPRVGLSELYVDPSARYLRARGGELRLATPVRELELGPDGHRVAGLRVKGDPQLRRYDHVVVATGPLAAQRLLGSLHDFPTDDEPASLRSSRPAAWTELITKVGNLGRSPIVSLWARVDRVPFSGNFVGLVDAPIHWLFARDRIEGRAPPKVKSSSLRPASPPVPVPESLTATISGASDLVGQSQAQLQSTLAATLRDWFPEHPTKILEFRAIKEKSATIAQTPATSARRPGIQTPVRNLWLAGDWVDTGLPATIESAALAGHRAAALVAGEAPT